MSTATAGKVLLIPKGEYDATTQYKVLDWVLYQGRPYVAKTTTTGNAPIYAPTPQNPDDYWQLLLDFPTIVDNVPTEDSNNLVKSGGVYSVTADKMKADGSNAGALALGPDSATSFMSATISKDAGTNEDVSVVFAVTGSDPNLARNIRYILTSHIGDDLIYIKSGGGNVRVTIASVTQAADDSAITAIGKLVEDEAEAISHSSYISFNAYNNGNRGDVAFGPGAAVQVSGAAIGKFAASDDSYAMALGKNVAAHGGNSFATGYQTTTVGDQSFAEGYQTMAWGNGSHAEGNHTDAHGNYSHAGGSNSEAGAENSFAFGDHAKAYNPNETSVGVYNANYNASGKKSLFDVGNGDSNTRSNAFTVYEDGMMANGAGHIRYKISKENGVWGYRCDDDNSFHPFTGYKELVQTGITLSTSQETDVTFTDASINSDSTIEVFTDTYGVNPTNVDSTTTSGTCVVTLPKVSSVITVECKIRVS